MMNDDLIRDDGQYCDEFILTLADLIQGKFFNFYQYYFLVSPNKISFDMQHKDPELVEAAYREIYKWYQNFPIEKLQEHGLTHTKQDFDALNNMRVDMAWQLQTQGLLSTFKWR